MTDTPYDRAPGDIAASTEVEERTRSDVGIYTIGLALAVILTATSFWVANTSPVVRPLPHLWNAVRAIDLAQVAWLHSPFDESRGSRGRGCQRRLFQPLNDLLPPRRL
jgi:hypothetical protein